MLREEVRAKVSLEGCGLSIGSITSMWLCQASCKRALLRHHDNKLLHTQELPCGRQLQPVGRLPHQALAICQGLPG